MKEYLRRYDNGTDVNREVSIIISGKTGVILMIRGVFRPIVFDEWYPVMVRNGYGGIECKFIGGKLLVRKGNGGWDAWVEHKNECESYPYHTSGECEKRNIICVIDILPDDQENCVPCDLYESIRV
jgi:hypothetical protein